MPLWDEKPKSSTKIQSNKTDNIKLKKGETLDTLIIAARKLVEEKLGKYKDTSMCVIEPKELIDFFNETEEDGLMALDTETTRFKYVYRYTCGYICL